MQLITAPFFRDVCKYVSVHTGVLNTSTSSARGSKENITQADVQWNYYFSISWTWPTERGVSTYFAKLCSYFHSDCFHSRVVSHVNNVNCSFQRVFYKHLNIWRHDKNTTHCVSTITCCEITESHKFQWLSFCFFRRYFIVHYSARLVRFSSCEIFEATWYVFVASRLFFFFILFKKLFLFLFSLPPRNWLFRPPGI